MPDPNVNVFFHGMFLFVERPNFIEVLIPNMGAEHAYRAGKFLVEETLQPRSMSEPYLLTGVRPGNKGFTSPPNIIFEDQDYDHTAGPDDVYARILVPKPMDLRSLRPTEAAFEAYVDGSGVVDGHTTCGLQVLRYLARNLDNIAVQLAPHTAPLESHQLKSQPGKDFVNLHIFAEHDGNAPLLHAIEGFQKTLQLIPGLRGKIFITNTTVLSPPTDPGGVFPAMGFGVHETLDLGERFQILSVVAEGLRDDDFSSFVAPTSTSVGDPPQDCNPLIIRKG